MKIKNKLNAKNIFKAILVIVFLSNIFFIYKTYMFIDEYIYKTLVPDGNYNIPQSSVSSGDINMDKFDNVIIRLEKKSIKTDLSNTKKIF